MRLFKTVHDFPYAWNLVSAANWQKYPNDASPHVCHVDVLSRSVNPDTGVLTTERLFTVKQNVPGFILKILGTGTTHYVREISIIDPAKKTLTMHSVNLTMNNLLTVQETIEYKEHPEDNQRTQFSQQATISAGSLVSRWGGLLEDFTLKRFQQNAVKGREGFHKVLERFTVMAEGSPKTAEQEENANQDGR